MISGPGDVEELGRAFVGDRAGEQGLAGAGRAVEQYALGRIDSEPLEQLGVAQRKLDHFAQRIDRVAHSAEVVIGDVGPTRSVAAPSRAVYSGSSSTAVLPSMWTMPLGAAVTTTSRSSWSANAGALSSWRMLSGMSALIRWCPAVATVSPSTSGRPAKLRLSASADPWRRTFGCAGAKTTRVAGLDFGLADLDEIARADASVGALQAIEADDVDALVLAIGADRPRRGRALADDLDHVAFVETELLHQLVGQPGKAAAAVGGRQARDLHLARFHAVDRRLLQALSLLTRLVMPIAQRRRCGAVSMLINI